MTATIYETANPAPDEGSIAIVFNGAGTISDLKLKFSSVASVTSLTSSGGTVTLDLTSKPFYAAQFTFMSSTTYSPGAITIESVTGNASGGMLGYSLGLTPTFVGATVPEPNSMALLGIAMTSFLAFRRFFKRPVIV